jgi:L-aminopeptidase/D-esterase-like protein
MQHAGRGVLPRLSGEAGRSGKTGDVSRGADLASWGFGIAVGHATDDTGGTGLTVVRGVDAPLRASAHVLGRATGTRELALLDPSASNERIDAVLLTGGSAYGLDAAGGVLRWMEEHGRGFPIAGGVVPIVPAAVVFDLAPLGRFDARPTAEMAYRACDAARPNDIDEGSVGVGTGCTVGKVLGPARAMKGGVGVGLSEPQRTSAGVMAAAVAAVNAFGHVRGRDHAIIAGARQEQGGLLDTEAFIAAGGLPGGLGAGGHTTLSVIALNAALSKVELHQVARAASAAYHRHIGPAGTSFDGDVIFAVSPLEGRRVPLIQAELAATAALEQAIVRAVEQAKGRDGLPGLAD